MRKIIVIALLLGLSLVLSLSLSAQEVTTVQTSQSRLVVNGHGISGKILEADGKHFVAIEDLAQSLGGTIGYGEGHLTLTFPRAVPAGATSPANGTIKGTLTFYFNANYGDKPDSGSPVFLVKGHVEIPETTVFVPILDENGFLPGTKYAVLKSTMADGDGNFEIGDVPAGQYTIIMQSNHVNALNQRDAMGKVRYRDVQVTSGKTVDESLDFGIKTAP